MSLDETMRRAAGEYGPRCELCEASSATPNIHLPTKHHPECPHRFSASERVSLQEIEEAKLRKALASMLPVVGKTLPVSQRRADIQRGARAAARLVREHAATWPAGLSAPQDARDAKEFAERIALAIEHTFSDEEIERRIQAAIDDAVLAEFDARSQEG